MASRKDQLDAFNFARRRVVANLVVPSATGSDEGAPRPVRTFASSIILSAIAVAAVAVLGVFKPAAPSGWQNGLAVDSSSGAAYIDQGNELHPVSNITSARLILGSKFAKYNVPDSTLNSSSIPIGATVGIPGAPEDVPAASKMTLSQWSFCQNEKDAQDETVPGGSTYLEVGYWPASTSQGLWTAASDQAMVVHDSADQVYLIDGNHRYLVGNDKSDHSDVQAYLSGISAHTNVSDDVTGYWVSDTWLSAFPLGSPISYPKLDDVGATPNGTGQLGTVGQYGPLSTGGGIVQTVDGTVTLSQFAYDLYIANSALSTVAPLPSSKLTPAAIDAARAGSSGATANNAFESGTYGSNWPMPTPQNLWGTDTTEAYAQNICVGYQYTNAAGVGNLTTWLSSQLPYGAPGGKFGLSTSGSGGYANTILVKPGYGLIAQGSNGGAAQNYEYLIEDSGYRYALLSDKPASSADSSQTVSAVGQLGYSGVTVEPVLNNLLYLIPVGAALDPGAAADSSGTTSVG